MTYCSSSNKELISSDELYCLVLLHPVRGLPTNPRGLVVAYTSDAGSAAITTNKNRTEGLRLSWQHLSPADRPVTISSFIQKNASTDRIAPSFQTRTNDTPNFQTRLTVLPTLFLSILRTGLVYSTVVARCGLALRDNHAI